MFRPIFVFTADSHLQRCQWVKRPTLAGDAYHAFASTLEWAAEQNVPVVHGGDLFDVKKPDSEAVTFFQLQLDRFGLRFYFVQGDHDFSTPPWASLAPLATPLHKQCRNIGGLNVCGLDFAPRGAIQADLADVPAATDVLVTHLAWTEAQGIGQTDADVADVANATLILSGDFHTQGTWTGVNADGHRATIYSPGSPVATKIDEITPREFLVVGEEDGQIAIRRQRVPLQRLGFCFDIADEPGFDDLIDRLLPTLVAADASSLPEELRAPIVRVRYPDSIPEAYERLQRFAAHVHLFLDPRHVVEEAVVVIDASREHAFQGLSEAVVALAKDEQIRVDALRLLTASDVGEEYDRMLEEHLRQAGDMSAAADLP